jgi:hypothetical protein
MKQNECAHMFYSSTMSPGCNLLEISPNWDYCYSSFVGSSQDHREPTSLEGDFGIQFGCTRNQCVDDTWRLHFFYQIHFAFEGCEVCCGPIHACNPDLVKNNEHTMHLYFFNEKCKLYGYSCLTRGVDLLTLPRFPRASGLFLLQATRGRLGLKTF